MSKKFIFFILLFLINHSIMAETCPSIDAIKNQLYNNWKAFSNEEGEPLTIEELKIFSNTADHFDSARWLDGAPEGESHCYYRKKNGKATYAFLSKANLKPADFSAESWHYVGSEPQCNINIDACRFINA